jgi:hypothetical protein
MKPSVKTIISVAALVGWVLLVHQRSALFSSGSCDAGASCDLVTSISISLVGLYISLELLIAPQSAALYLLSKTLSRGRASPEGGRVLGLLGMIAWSLVLFWSVSQLLRFTS